MATQAAIEHWDKVLHEVQKIRRDGWIGEEGMTPQVRGKQYKRDLPMIMALIFMPFLQAWATNRPNEESDLYELLEPIALAAEAPLDFTQAAVPQVEPIMELVAHARDQLRSLEGPTDPDEVIRDIEHLLKVSVLVARVGHQGASNIVDTELQARFEALNKNQDRAPTYLDLHTFQVVKSPSKTAISMEVFLSMVDPGVATLEERMQWIPNEENQPPIMKQFAAQWVVNLHTEWEEHFRGELATALGCEPRDVRSDYFADLGKMRNDYVHNRGICRRSARNKVLKWYREGDQMIPKHANYLQLMETFPANELRSITPSPATVQRQPVKANADPDLARQFLVRAEVIGITKDQALDQALSEWLALHTPAE